MNQKHSKEIRVGTFIFIALSIMIFMVFMLGGKNRLFARKATYKILFRSATGLFQGDPVLLTGVEVGNVTKIGFPKKLEEKKILLEISVDKSVSSRIRKDTRANLGSASLVYGKVVVLTMGSPEQPIIQEGEFIPAEEGSRFEAIVDSTSLILEDTRRILAKINRGDGALSIMLNRPMELPETMHHLSVSTERLASLLDKVNRGQGPVGAVLTDSADFKRTLQEVQSTVSDLRSIAARLKDNRSVMGKLINDSQYGDAVLTDLRSTLHSLSSITAKIDTGKGTIGLLINHPDLFQSIEDVVVGMEKSKLTKWMIQNRRKSGEEERLKKSGKQ